MIYCHFREHGVPALTSSTPFNPNYRHTETHLLKSASHRSFYVFYRVYCTIRWSVEEAALRMNY